MILILHPPTKVGGYLSGRSKRLNLSYFLLLISHSYFQLLHILYLYPLTILFIYFLFLILIFYFYTFLTPYLLPLTFIFLTLSSSLTPHFQLLTSYLFLSYFLLFPHLSLLISNSLPLAPISNSLPLTSYFLISYSFLISDSSFLTPYLLLLTSDFPDAKKPQVNYFT